MLHNDHAIVNATQENVSGVAKDRRMRDGRGRRAKHSAAGPRSDVDLGPLTGLIGYMLRRAQIAVFQDIFRTFAQVGIRPAQFSVLTVIAHNPGRTQSQVSAALGIKRTNFVALLDSLERRGLAVRKPAPTDRRSHALHLTEAGKATMRRLNQLVDKLEGRMIAQIGKDGRVALLALLHRLAEGERRGAAGEARPARRGRTAGDAAPRQPRSNRSFTSRGTG
jgi:DNA-binding MarR family transcriptional regulator